MMLYSIGVLNTFLIRKFSIYNGLLGPNPIISWGAIYILFIIQYLLNHLFLESWSTFYFSAWTSLLVLLRKLYFMPFLGRYKLHQLQAVTKCWWSSHLYYEPKYLLCSSQISANCHMSVFHSYQIKQVQIIPASILCPHLCACLKLTATTIVW